MKTAKDILAIAGQFKNAIVLITFFVVGYQQLYDEFVDDVATEVVARTGDQNYRLFKLQQKRDSLRFDAAAELAAEVLARQDSIVFVMNSITLWQQDVDRKMDKVIIKLATDTVATRQQRELFEIRRLLREKEAAEQRRIETEQAWREYLKRSIERIEAIKRGDRAQ